VSELRLAQQEQQEQIRRVDEEQKRHARILDDMLQRLRDEREARLRLDADTSRNIETLALRVGELTQERYRE
jgi:N6-adenosine-specific RNA methylase IME4